MFQTDDEKIKYLDKWISYDLFFREFEGKNVSWNESLKYLINWIKIQWITFYSLIINLYIISLN